MTCCQGCGVEAPTKYVEFYQNIGALVLRFSKSVKGNLCKRCINENFWSLTGITLFLGWWGVISLIITPFILLNNIFRYLFALGLEAPAPGAKRLQLDDDSIGKIHPFVDEIVQLLNQGVPMEQVTEKIAVKAGVTPGQVFLYLKLLAQHAAKSS